MSEHRYLPGVTTLALDPSLCNGCQMCTTVCPHAVFRVEDKRAAIADRDACMECGACARNCEQGAITVDAGVGCAAAIIAGALGLKRSCCCTLDEPLVPLDTGSKAATSEVDPAPC